MLAWSNGHFAAVRFHFAGANEMLFSNNPTSCYASPMSTRMEHRVDLSLNLNVLAVFAAVAFVAALLLGAF
jgi:hypothetical protein